jgi:predicted secreted protein
MAAKKGSLMRLYQGDGETPEVFTLVGGVRTIGWRFGMEPIDTTTQEDIDADGVSYRTSIPGIASGGGPVEGVAKDYTTQGWVTDALQGTRRNYRVEIPNYGTLTAEMFFTNVEFQGPFDGVVGYTAELVLASAPTTVLESVAPTNSLLPSVVGTPQVGVQLVANDGAWNGGGIVYTRQWQELISSVWTNIAGATSRTYTPVVGSVGRPLRVQITATNATGALTVSSGPTAAVLAE